jgi:hypothetical protein
MKCQHCSRDVKPWQSHCSHCRSRLPKNPYSTIGETAETLEQHSRRRLLRQILQFALLAALLLALATVLRFGPPKASPLPPANVNAQAGSVPSPTPTPEQLAPQEPTSALPVSSPTPAPSAKLEPLAGSSETPLQATSTPIALLRKEAALATRPRLAAPSEAAAPATPATDDVAPKKVTTPPLVTTPVPAPPAPTVEAAEPRLEVESSGVTLNANTGLVTIKSYVPARIYIDGVYSGTTPRSVKLLAGEHIITLLAQGHQDYTRKVKVSGQQQMGILASMSKK